MDSLYRPFFSNITFCSVTGNKTLMELVQERGYRILIYRTDNIINEYIGDGWLAYRLYSVSL